MLRFSLLMAPLMLVGCQTLQERMAEKVGCEPTNTSIEEVSWSPWHAVRIIECSSKQKSFKCVEAPFVHTCKPYDAEADAKAREAKKKKKKK